MALEKTREQERIHTVNTVCESLINYDTVSKEIRRWNLFPTWVETAQDEKEFIDSVYDEFKTRLPDCVY